MPELVIAVDPGREKCGIAVVHQETGVVYKNVVAAGTIVQAVQQLAELHAINTVIIGDRTGSKATRVALERITVNGKSLIVISTDEHRSSEEARRRYWQENPPGGLKRLIPTTMQSPPGPIDDYVAVILAERYFATL